MPFIGVRLFVNNTDHQIHTLLRKGDEFICNPQSQQARVQTIFHLHATHSRTSSALFVRYSSVHRPGNFHFLKFFLGHFRRFRFSLVTLHKMAKFIKSGKVGMYLS